MGGVERGKPLGLLPIPDRGPHALTDLHASSCALPRAHHTPMSPTLTCIIPLVQSTLPQGTGCIDLIPVPSVGMCCAV